MKNDEKKVLDKWKSILDHDNDKASWLEQYTDKQLDGGILSNSTLPLSSHTDGFTTHIGSLLPIVKRISASTIGMGGTKKSETQQLRENRLNKLRQIDGKKHNVILPDDEDIPGLVSVQPMSSPSGNLMFMDFKYTDIKTERRKKIGQIEKNQKILEILEMLRNNI